MPSSIPTMGKPSRFSGIEIKSDFGRLPRASTRNIKGRTVEWVYFVQSLAEPYRIKIGKTHSLRGRLMMLQWMCPVPLAFLGAHAWPEFTEPAIHECFKDLRSHGEWFYPGDNLMSAIEAMDALDGPQAPMAILEFFAPYSSPKIDTVAVHEQFYIGRAGSQAKRRRAMESAYFDEKSGYRPKGSVKYSRDFEVPR